MDDATSRRRPAGAGLRPRPRHPLAHAADVPGADPGHHHVHRAPDRDQLPLEPAGPLQRRGGPRGGADRPQQQRPTSTSKWHTILPRAASTAAAARGWDEGSAPRAGRDGLHRAGLLQHDLRHPGRRRLRPRPERRDHDALRGRLDLRRARPSTGRSRSGSAATSRWTNDGPVLGHDRRQRRARHRLRGRRSLLRPRRGAERVHPRAPGGAGARDPLHPRPHHGGRARASGPRPARRACRRSARTSTPAPRSPPAPAAASRTRSATRAPAAPHHHRAWSRRPPCLHTGASGLATIGRKGKP